jgi:hypothetical protein
MPDDNGTTPPNDGQGGKTNDGQAPAGNNGNPAPENNPATPSGDGKTVPLAALQESRQETKDLKARLDTMEADAKAKADAEAAKKGEFETLYNTTKTDLEAANTKVTDLQAQVDGFNESVENGVKSALEGIKDEKDRTLISGLLDGKTALEKQTLLPGLIEKFGQPKNVNPNVKGDPKSGDKPTRADLETKLAEAKKNKDSRSVFRIEAQMAQLKV